MEDSFSDGSEKPIEEEEEEGILNGGVFCPVKIRI